MKMVDLTQRVVRHLLEPDFVNVVVNIEQLRVCFGQRQLVEIRHHIALGIAFAAGVGKLTTNRQAAAVIDVERAVAQKFAVR